MILLDIAADLLLRADQPGDAAKLVLGEEGRRWPEGAVEALANISLIEPYGAAPHFSCTECDEPHSEVVHFRNTPEQSKPFIYCPANGRVELEPWLLQRWRITLRSVAEQLAKTLSTGMTPREIVRGRHWTLGTSANLNSLEVHLIRGAGWPDAPARFSSLASRGDSVIFTLTDSVPDWVPRGRGYTVRSLVRAQNGSLVLVAPSPEVLNQSVAGDAYALVRSGRHWSVTWRGETKTLNHYVGLTYIAQLLANPGREIGALDLLSSFNSRDDHTTFDQDAELSVVGAEGSEEVVDQSARQQYQTQIAALHAKKRSHGLSEEEQAELVNLQNELRRVIGLGGKARRVAGPQERARTNISKAIGRVESSLAEVMPSLAMHIQRCIRRGAVFVYAPDEPVHWRIAPSV